MITERDWYGKDWKFLRTQLVKLCLQHSAALLVEFHGPINLIDTLISDFMEQVREDVRRKIVVDQLGLWQNSLPLLMRPEWLQVELLRDRDALCGRKATNGLIIEPQQALARKLNQFFEMNRREHVATDLGVSANKVKTWERLDRISRKVADEKNISRRCTDEHFEDLANHVRSEYGHDKNLPSRTKTIKGYFYRFSAECVERIEDREDTMEKLSLEEAKELLQGVGMAELARCLRQLSPENLAIVDVAFKLGACKVHYRSIDDYMTNHSLSAKQFAWQQQEVLDSLRQCLELSLSAQYGGLQ